MLHTFDDDGGFLRTRHCYWDKPVPNHNVPDLEKVLVCFREEYHEGDKYIEKSIFGKETLVKIQLFYCEYDADDVKWSSCVGYGIPYEIDLHTKTYHRLENENKN